MMTIALLLVICLVILILLKWTRNIEKQPPRLRDFIPYISNTWEFMTNKKWFIARVTEALRRSPVVQCQLGPLNLYFITGTTHVSTLFKTSFSSDPWVLRILERIAGYLPVNLVKFSRDNSGCSRQPLVGSDESVRPEERIWYALHNNYSKALIGPQSVQTFSKSYQAYFDRQLAVLMNKEAAGGLDVFNFLRQSMSNAATRAMFGPGIIDVNPDFIDAFWKFEKWAEPLVFGLPSWLNRTGIKARDRMNAMCTKWYELSDRKFDWDSAMAGTDDEWEPIFGSPMSRGLARWGKSFNFSTDSMGPVYTLFVFALHSNTIPICTWIMMELLQDADLLRAIKLEVSQALVHNKNSSEKIDLQKLLSMPLLQSVYVEALRLHVGILITRTSTAPVTIAGYNFPAGTVFQAPTQVSHIREDVWGTPEYPASQFWAYRHVKEKHVTNEAGGNRKHLELSISARSGAFYPYGGGASMCPGRNLAKAEVLLTVAMLVSRLDMKFVEWLKLDGSISDRPAQDDTKYANSVAAPPDREMRVRWQKV
ncbi:cytochrome P450 [Xylaria castorea]|nr:cytochrome P450 [Xylaria castorea]